MAMSSLEQQNDLLLRIHNGQSEVEGNDLKAFERLLILEQVVCNGISGPDRYTEVSTTPAGEIIAMAPPYSRP